MWQVGVVLFICVLELHPVVLKWMCGRCIDFSTKHVSLV